MGSVSSLSDISPTTVVSSANLIMELEVWMGVQSWVNNVKRIRLSTQLCGVPVFRMSVEEMWLPFHTCGLPVRKSMIYEHS